MQIMKSSITQGITKVLLTCAAALCINFSAFATPIDQQINTISQASGLQPDVVKLALQARQWAASHAHINQDILAIVDYTKPSTTPRLFVFNLKTDQLLMKLLVAHGKNSGTPQIAKYFSNSPKSLESSLGVFIAGNIYNGKHGTSRRLIGLEPKINDNAVKRALVIHPAAYVNNGFVGRSWGCLAVNPHQASKLIKTLNEGSVIFAYAPQEKNDKNIISQSPTL